MNNSEQEGIPVDKYAMWLQEQIDQLNSISRTDYGNGRLYSLKRSAKNYQLFKEEPAASPVIEDGLMSNEMRDRLYEEWRKGSRLNSWLDFYTGAEAYRHLTESKASDPAGERDERKGYLMHPGSNGCYGTFSKIAASTEQGPIPEEVKGYEADYYAARKLADWYLKQLRQRQSELSSAREEADSFRQALEEYAATEMKAIAGKVLAKYPLTAINPTT